MHSCHNLVHTVLIVTVILIMAGSDNKGKLFSDVYNNTMENRILMKMAASPRGIPNWKNVMQYFIELLM